MHRLTALAILAAAAASLGCGPLFCVDTARCWQQVERDTFRRFDTGTDVDVSDGLAVLTVQERCDAERWFFHAEFEGRVDAVSLTFGRVGDLVEDHPGAPMETEFGAFADWSLVVGDYAPGLSTTLPCEAEPELAYLVRVAGAGEERCVAWGPGAEEIGPGCDPWF